MANPVFEARDTRYIYAREDLNNSAIVATSLHARDQNALLRQQTISMLEPRKSERDSSGFDLWLICPPEKRSAEIIIRKIDSYSMKHERFAVDAHQERNLYR